MVQSARAYGLFFAVGLALAVPAAGSQKEADPDTPRTEKLQPASSHLPRRLETPQTRVTSCDICADLACVRVQVRGPCTVGKAVEALRRQQKQPRAAPERAPHRSRAVTGADYERLVLEEAPETGRASAAPEHHPQDHADSAARLLDVYENSDRPLGVRESDSLSVKTPSFRPLVLNDETPGEDTEADGEDEQKP